MRPLFRGAQIEIKIMKSTMTTRAIIALLLPAASTQAAVVFSEINLTNNSILLSNVGGEAIDLDGWRFCSHDTNSVRVYSSSSQFNGMSIAAGGTGLTPHLGQF